MTNRRRGRELALRLLFEWDVQGGDIDTLSTDFWRSNLCKEEIKIFCEKLVYGTISHIEKIDEWISRFLEHWKLNRISRVDRSIIRSATYELLYLNDIPSVVTINEAIEIAKRYGTEESWSFVNGILDKIRRESGCESVKREDGGGKREDGKRKANGRKQW